MVFSSRSTLILILGVALQHSEAWIAPCPARVGCWGGSGAVQRSNSQSAVKLGATAGVQDSTSGLRPVLLCPAQFGYPPSRLIPSVWRSGCSLLSVLGNLLFVLVAVGECCRFANRAGTARDYISLKADLKERGFALYPAPLTRLSWLRIVPSILTPEFFTGTLTPGRTLGFFYEAIDAALVEIERDFPGQQVSFLGHSIGGWVARSYIAEVLGEEVAKVKVASLVTLGTPHNSAPADSPVAALDQTRGLLKYINDNFPSGWPLDRKRVACVAGKGTSAPSELSSLLDLSSERIWDKTRGRSKLIEETVALASYLPLCGEALGVEGDGLIPVQTALMPDTSHVVLEDCNHASFVPTLGRSLLLPETYKWYGSEGLIDEWSGLL